MYAHENLEQTQLCIILLKNAHREMLNGENVDVLSNEKLGA